MAHVNFRGRRILLIVPSFFGYDREITARLSERGAVVKAYDDRPPGGIWTKTLNRIDPRLVARSAARLVEHIIDQCKDMEFDDILVVKGEALDIKLLRRIFKCFPNARTTYYMWDSFQNARGAREKMVAFHRCFTFDPVDAQSTPGLRFRPLFFVNHYVDDADKAPVDLDLLFIGTVHTDRYGILKKLAKSLPANCRHYYFLYFPARYIYFVRRWLSPQFWQSKPEEFSFKPLSHRESSILYARTRAVIDVERAVQTGLTMRTFEVLAAKKKLITTNASILKADIYDEVNVAVIERNNPKIKANFLTEPFRPIDPTILYKYSLDGWLDDLLSY